MKKTILILASATLLSSVFFSCNRKDKNNEEPQPTTEVKVDNPLGLDYKNQNTVKAIPTVFESLDGADVSSKISIANATKIAGTPPPPTNDGFPLITLYSMYGDDENMRIFNNTGLKLGVNYSSFGTEPEGVYLSIDGANEYFDIPVNNSALRVSKVKKEKTLTSVSGKTRKITTADIVIPIEIPSSITTGTFCITYCIYADGFVSQPITRCVELQEFGGENAVFADNTLWKFKSAILYYNNKTIAVERGKAFSNTFYECGGNTTKETIHKYDYRFQADGAFNIDLKYEGVYYDSWYNDGCEPDYYDEEEVFTGAWGYNDQTKTLTMIEEYDEYGFNWVVEYKVNHQNNKMAFTFLEEYEDGSEFLSYILNFEK